MTQEEKMQTICEQLDTKSNLKIKIFEKATEAFKMLQAEGNAFIDLFKSKGPHPDIPISFESNKERCFTLIYGSDVLFCELHSNVFEFNRDHEVMKTSYIRDDKNRSYCGMISIFNFLNDSVKYDRYNDSGYLIGRIFINVEGHCFIDGKREVGQIYNNFSSTIFDQEMAKTILESALLYTINFDLLVPPYEMMQEISVSNMIEMNNQHSTVKTAKRLGFRFQADTE